MLWKQTVMVKIICYKNQERLILAMNLGMKLIGWSGDFYGLGIFAVSNYRAYGLFGVVMQSFK